MKPFFTKHYRHFQRYHDIIRIISAHGFGYLLEAGGIRQVRWPWRNAIPKATLNMAERLRMTLAELGPTFIKLGQVLSTRPDLLPAPFISQLELLQDQVLPVPFPEIKQALETEIGQSLEQIFTSFDSQPLAAASIGQVHQAVLTTGERVAVKVQRPEILKTIETDLEILTDTAEFLGTHTQWGKFYQVQNFMTEFARTIRDELDYTLEAKNAERFREIFKGDTRMLIPKVHWKWTSKKILILDFVAGWKITATSELDQNGISRSKLAQALSEAFLKQILIDGFFHADPHPGNILISKKGVIILMDFGMVGRLDGWLKDQLVKILLSIIRRDESALFLVLDQFRAQSSRENQHLLRRELYYLLDRYSGRALQDIELGPLFRDLLELSSRFQLRPPQELVLIGRCLVLLENIISRLDPGTSLLELAKPFSRRLILEKFAPKNLQKMTAEYLLDLASTLRKLPGKTTELLQIIKDGDLELKIEQRHFDIFISKMVTAANRLSSSIMIAAIIIGSSLISFKTAATLFGRFPIAEIGFLTATIMGIWLFLSIIRSGRI